MKPKRYFRIIAAVAVVAVLIAGVALVAHSRKLPTSNGRVAVTASFYPMAEFARRVGGDKVQVTTLVRPGVEPHDYDPTPQDIAGIYKSKLLVYNGAGLERWVSKIQKDLAANHVTIVAASSGVNLQAKDASDTADPSPTDPHVWMDPVLAIREVTNIRDGLIEADPKDASAFAANASAYIAKLQQLDSDFKSGLSACQNHTIITSHQAFQYSGKQYGITSVGIAGLSPDDEPSPAKLAEVANTARANNVHYIFFEQLVSPKLSQTIAQEVGAQTIAFNPLEGLTNDEVKAGKDYISVQKDNLQALRVALDCK